MATKVKQPDSTQLKGADGVFETVTVGGVRMNAHEHDPDEHGEADEPKKGGARKAGSRGDPEEMTVEELKAYLDKQGIEYASDDLKDDLVKKAKKGK